jgi:hypothetical protein
MNAAAMRLLADKGLSLEDIIEVADALASRKPDPTNAERQRRHRERQKERNAVTVTPVTESENAPSLILTPVTPKGVTAPKGSVRNRGSKIPEGWTPPAVDELGPDFRKLASQWTDDSYRTEASAFRSYWLAETGVKASKSCWKRAWENRIAQIHGKVMRDQRFAAPSNDTGGGYLDHMLAKRARSP